VRAVVRQRPAAPLSSVLGKSTPPDLGVPLTEGEGLWGGGLIYSEEELGTGGSPINGVAYFTFYAYVDPVTVSTYGLSLPKGSVTGTYGAEACGGASSGIVNNWDCNSADWSSATKVGDAYNLRAVTCYDQSVQAARTAGVSWGTLSGQQCADAP
jgi:hypothetical protein